MPELIKVLIVEDEQITALNIAGILKGFGFIIAGSVSTGEEAVESAAILAPDIILMDISLAGEIDGIEAAARIKKKTGTPVIYMTANADVITVQRARDTEPYGYVLKPIKNYDLYSTIDASIHRRRLEERVKSSEQRYRLLFHNSPIGIFYYEPDLVIRECNVRFAEILQSDIEKIIGLDMRLLKDTSIMPALSAALMGGEGFFEGPYNTTISGIQIWVAMRTVPIRDCNGAVIAGIGIVEDISARIKAEKGRVVLEEQIIQMQRLESIGRLAGGIAHDFNNMLFSILGHAELALLDTKPSDALYQSLLEIMRSGERAKNLTRQLLAFGRKQVLEFSPVDINALITEFDRMMKRLIGEDIHILLALNGDVGFISGDKTHVEQILMNLSVNARDAMPDGGTLVISTSLIDIEAEDITGLQVGKYILLKVSDSGVGIDSEMMTHIFEPFYTTKDKDKGTGLGLSMVYGIVKQHSGDIYVESQPGHGTTFSIYLPEVPGDKCGLISNVAPKKNISMGTETILLVEDEDSVRKLVSGILTARGYTVIDTDDPRIALELARDNNNKIDLLLTDIVMRYLNGRELYEKIAAVRPDIKVIYMSGYTADIISHHGVLNDGINYIQKPFTVDSLTMKVRSILDSVK